MEGKPVSLIENIKTIQRAVGVRADGVFGPRTAAEVLKHLARVEMVEDAGETPALPLDERTLKTLATLDAKARADFEDFMLLAKATAATMGCDYIAISGTRTWEEQAELHRKYKAGGPKAAAPGYSWHNYGVAIDCGVFKGGGKIYCDDTQPALAERVHAACAAHAKPCGLLWGGEFKGKSCDPPHYQIYRPDKTPTAAYRAKFKAEGSVL
jgi:peptidoglycan L-alanyl-D-glutamate endopeptidase CwlK